MLEQKFKKKEKATIDPNILLWTIQPNGVRTKIVKKPFWKVMLGQKI